MSAAKSTNAFGGLRCACPPYAQRISVVFAALQTTAAPGATFLSAPPFTRRLSRCEAPAESRQPRHRFWGALPIDRTDRCSIQFGADASCATCAG